jgi:hypothetical protein
MKTKQIEKLLLLEQTGELSSRQRRKLAVCSEVQAKRDELKAFCAAVPAADVEPSPWVATKIAARLRTERRPVLIFSKHWKTTVALAACLAVITGILNFHGNQKSSTVVVAVAAASAEDVWNDPLEEDLSRLESLIVAISGDPLDIMEM